MTDNIPIARSEALILDRDGPPTLGLEAARVLARIIRADRDQHRPGCAKASGEELGNRRPGEGHSRA